MAYLLTVANHSPANILAALVLGLVPLQNPDKPPLDSGPAGVNRSGPTVPPPLIYSGARYGPFLGGSHGAPTFRRQHFSGTSSSPYQPIEGPRSGMPRYYGAGR
jgi:hypothetical protein